LKGCPDPEQSSRGTKNLVIAIDPDSHKQTKKKPRKQNNVPVPLLINTNQMKKEKQTHADTRIELIKIQSIPTIE